MVNLLVAAALAAAPVEPVAPVNADPAIFQVRDEDTTIYVFGTFHALDGRSDWFNDEVKTAFDRSGELVLETVVPFATPGAPGPRPAFKASPAAQVPAHVTPSASFLATTKMAISAGRDHGLTVANGADMVLRRAAELTGKRLEGLETLESQFNLFARMPAATAAPAPPPRAGEPVDLDNPRVTLAKSMVAMQGAWNRGDQAIFVHMLDQLERGAPDTYRMLFTERNARWADWIAARMETPGTVFVAVGAGHLAGKDSLLVRLAQMGIESSRVD